MAAQRLKEMTESLTTMGGNELRNQTDNQRDLETQAVISVALGLSAFLTFCVKYAQQRSLQVYLLISHKLAGFATKMDRSLRCAKETKGCCLEAARSAEYILWMDACSLSCYGGPDSCCRWSRCIRGTYRVS